MLRNDVTRFLTTILIGTTYRDVFLVIFFQTLFFFYYGRVAIIILVHLLLSLALRVVNIGATALVTEATTAIFGEAGVSAATAVMTVCPCPFYDYFTQSLSSSKLDMLLLIWMLFLISHFHTSSWIWLENVFMAVTWYSYNCWRRFKIFKSEIYRYDCWLHKTYHYILVIWWAILGSHLHQSWRR